jgi:hypothetical protein
VRRHRRSSLVPPGNPVLTVADHNRIGSEVKHLCLHGELRGTEVQSGLELFIGNAELVFRLPEESYDRLPFRKSAMHPRCQRGNAKPHRDEKHHACLFGRTGKHEGPAWRQQEIVGRERPDETDVNDRPRPRNQALATVARKTVA